MAYAEGRFSGSLGYNYKVAMTVDVIRQEVGNNRTLIRYSAWVEQIGSGWVSINSGSGSININGYNPGRGLPGGFNFNSAGQRRYFAQNEEYWIGHDGNGNANPFFTAHMVASANAGYLGGAEARMNVWMPHIDRYVGINSWGADTPTEKSFNIWVNADATADAFLYSLNGAGFVGAYYGHFGSRTATINNLKPGTTYNVRISIRKADSGMWTESGVKSITTNPAVLTSATNPYATDTTVDLRVSSNYVMDQIQYRRQDSETWISESGDFTTKQVTATGLVANTDYVFEMRARHRDSQTYTPVVTVNARTFLPQPLKSSSLEPTNGSVVSSTTPTLKWKYESTGIETQTAYQVVVYRESDSVVMVDSGKITSKDEFYEVPTSANLLIDESYQWKVRTWGSTDTTGPYTDLILFKVALPPDLIIQDPVHDSVIETDTPRISWTFTDNTRQTAATVTVTEINNPGETTGIVVFQELFEHLNHWYIDLPTGHLQDGKRYFVTVTVRDEDGLEATSDPVEFFVKFVKPAVPIVNAVLAEDNLNTIVDVTPGSPLDDGFEADTIRIYKRNFGDSNWLKIQEVYTNLLTIDEFSHTYGWTVTSNPEGSSNIDEVVYSEDTRDGGGSIGFSRTSARDGLTAHRDLVETVSLVGYSKIRLWMKNLLAYWPNNVFSIQIRMKTTSTDYFFFDISLPESTRGKWLSIEQPINTLQTSGSPNINNITQVEVKFLSTGGTGQNISGVNLIYIDHLRAVPINTGIYAYDYELQNNTQVEYGASAYSTYANIESDIISAPQQIEVEYGHKQNTFLVPVEEPERSVVAFMEGETRPSWTTTTSTAYLHPVGSKYPIAYTLANQKYKTGSITVLFLDECRNGLGLEGPEAIEALMNYKPLLLRTWWGKNYYISIDGNVTAERKKNIGWLVGFSFTEIGNEQK